MGHHGRVDHHGRDVCHGRDGHHGRDGRHGRDGHHGQDGHHGHYCHYDQVRTGQDRQNWHLNLTVQVTCLGQLSQFLRCF